MTSYCVVGPGAVGGALAAALHRSGADVCLLGRPGAHLDALRAGGLVLRTGAPGEATSDEVLDLPATDDAATLGPVDVVVLAAKTHALPAVAPAVQPLLHAETVVVPAVNGVPWWFLRSVGGELAGHRLTCLDADGSVERLLDPARVVGCVLHVSANVPAPGVVHHTGGDRVIVGDATREDPSRAAGVAEELTAGGWTGELVAGPAAIRTAVWVKLLGNMCFNPVSALTGGTLLDLTDDAGTADVISTMMREGTAVGAALGIDVPITVEARMEMSRQLGPVRTSMLQDSDAGRPLELDALVAAVTELGDLLGVDTPVTDVVLTLLRTRERLRA